MTTKQSIEQVIYDHLQQIRELTEDGLPNGDIQGVMEAESKNIYQLVIDLMDWQALKVKKLTSLHPDRYKTMKIEDALFAYAEYCYHCGYERHERPYKTFSAWLATEI